MPSIRSASERDLTQERSAIGAAVSGGASSLWTLDMNEARTDVLALRIHGGDDGDRTHDLRLAKPALSQLSYVPE